MQFVTEAAVSMNGFPLKTDIRTQPNNLQSTFHPTSTSLPLPRVISMPFLPVSDRSHDSMFEMQMSPHIVWFSNVIPEALMRQPVVAWFVMVELTEETSPL